MLHLVTISDYINKPFLLIRSFDGRDVVHGLLQSFPDVQKLMINSFYSVVILVAYVVEKEKEKSKELFVF